MGDVGEFLGGGSTQTGDVTTTITPGELSSQEQSSIDAIFESLGFVQDPVTGKITKTGQTNTEQRLSELATSFEDALSSDYTDSALESDLADQERILRAELSSRLGPDYATTTSGIQALSAFNSEANIARSESKSERELGFGALASSTLETLSDTELSGAGTLSNLISTSGDIRGDRGTTVTDTDLTTTNRAGASAIGQLLVGLGALR